MSYLKYNLPGLWFQIYREVLKYNKSLNDSGLDKGQLREVATSIFIATTNRGIVRPFSYTKFQVSLREMTKDIYIESKKQEIIDTVKMVLAKKKTKSNGEISA